MGQQPLWFISASFEGVARFGLAKFQDAAMFSSATFRSDAIAAVAFMLVSVSLTTAASASAAGPTSCPRDGYITRGDRCTSLSNGVLSVQTVSAGNYVAVNYYRSSGGSLSAKLGYERSGSTTYSSYIETTQAGRRRPGRSRRPAIPPARTTCMRSGWRTWAVPRSVPRRCHVRRSSSGR